jgi:hypothetical protein
MAGFCFVATAKPLTRHTPRTQVLIDLVAIETKQGTGGAATADPRISYHCTKPLGGGSTIAGPLGTFTGTCAHLKDLQDNHPASG